MNTRRTLLKLVSAVALLNAVPASARAARVQVLSGPAFGSAWRLVLPLTNQAAAAQRRIEQVLARVDALMSPFRADSELARFNASGQAVLSRETAAVTHAALALARDSQGAFDPTVAPLSRRYGFGAMTIAAGRPAGRFRDLRLAGATLSTVCLGLSLDLCGIAKGHALDEVARALDGLDFVFELGGELAARGRHPSGRAWRMGIERPGSDQLQRIFDADSRALATSGDAAQFYELGGRRYSHVMDPRARAPVGNRVASVSVLAATGMEADGLSTAAMVLGPEAARALLVTRGASALFLMRGPNGLQEVAINGFSAGSTT